MAVLYKIKKMELIHVVNSCFYLYRWWYGVSCLVLRSCVLIGRTLRWLPSGLWGASCNSPDATDLLDKCKGQSTGSDRTAKEDHGFSPHCHTYPPFLVWTISLSRFFLLSFWVCSFHPNSNTVSKLSLAGIKRILIQWKPNSPQESIRMLEKLWIFMIGKSEKTVVLKMSDDSFRGWPDSSCPHSSAIPERLIPADGG